MLHFTGFVKSAMIPSDNLARIFLEDIPPALMLYTCMTENLQEFNEKGFFVSTMLNLAALKHAGKKLHQFQAILDFGCGAGRLIQYIPVVAHPRVHGCDVNAALIEYVKQKFPAITSKVNNFNPPLAYADETFDLVYSFSVFSHLTQESELCWLEELSRVGTRNALYLITVHGDHFINGIFPEQKDAIVAKGGFHYQDVHTRDGGEWDFPVGYEASFHTHDNIRESWSRWFNILEIYDGSSTGEYLWPDATMSLMTDLSTALPMGQALVAMVKK
jgi:SAM-dependent methyltransferase